MTTAVPDDYAEWERVEACESGGVPADGPTYYGVLGMTEAAWVEGGGQEFAPTPYGATFDQQAEVATVVNHGYVPDGDGCHGW